jgi:predicted AAA+ superfamily ATPase
LIISDQKFVEEVLPIHTLGDKQLIIFDVLHKYPSWKNYIKGFHDQYKDHYNIIVTGSAHLNVFQKGGDSLMGRYFPFTKHPLSVGELGHSSIQNLVRSLVQISANDYDALYNFGGFPAPNIGYSTQPLIAVLKYMWSTPISSVNSHMPQVSMLKQILLTCVLSALSDKPWISKPCSIAPLKN